MVHAFRTHIVLGTVKGFLSFWFEVLNLLVFLNCRLVEELLRNPFTRTLSRYSLPHDNIIQTGPNGQCSYAC